MKAALVSLALIACCTALVAQPAPKLPSAPGVAKAAPHVIDPAARSNMLAKTGGIVQSKAEGPFILFLNTQKRVPSAAFRETPDQIRKNLRLSVAMQDRPSTDPVTEAQKALVDKNTAAVVVLTDTPGYPSLLIAPESRWALVNVSSLSGNSVSVETLTDRTRKEVWRAFGYLMGAAHSNIEQCLMKSVITPEDLDTLEPKTLSPEPFEKIMTHAQKLGMKPIRVTTYRKAVEEGWAPAPTNDFQQAIWKELKK